MATTYSPLRYPGGKSRLSNFFKQILDLNGLCDGHYIEPYAGGCGVAITLLRHDFVRYIHINDLDSSIYAFWNAVVSDHQRLCRMIRETEITVEEWHRQRGKYSSPESCDGTELAFATLFLNRTNRSGIIASGGIIGGVNQTGRWKIDARFNQEGLVQRIEAIARYRRRIVVHNQDAEELISNTYSEFGHRALVYLDPPYFSRSKRLYSNNYSAEDHKNLANAVKALTTPWIVSYDNASEIREFYSDHHQIQYDLDYTAAARTVGQELMVFSDDLALPEGLTSPLQYNRQRH